MYSIQEAKTGCCCPMSNHVLLGWVFAAEPGHSSKFQPDKLQACNAVTGHPALVECSPWSCRATNNIFNLF